MVRSYVVAVCILLRRRRNAAMCLFCIIVLALGFGSHLFGYPVGPLSLKWLRSPLLHADGNDPHILRSDLDVQISVASLDPPAVRVTMTNLHPESSVTLFRWDSPLDDDPMAAGLIHITDVESGDKLDPPKTALAKGDPSPESAFYRLEPLHAVTKDVTLTGVDLEVDKGKVYEIVISGTWRVVWQAETAAVGAERLKQLGGGSGFWRGEMMSNTIRMGSSQG